MIVIGILSAAVLVDLLRNGRRVTADHFGNYPGEPMSDRGGEEDRYGGYDDEAASDRGGEEDRYGDYDDEAASDRGGEEDRYE